jgi:SAM-dependent methyltransferase
VNDRPQYSRKPPRPSPASSPRPHGGSPPRGPKGPPYERLKKPPLRVQTTTLWEYPSQHYGEGMQGDQRYVGATPSYVIWNLIQRYTREGDLVVDPFCGSGTTLDVAKDTGRRARGFDIAPYREDIERADARKIPVETGAAQLVFLDPPYGDHIEYSSDPNCIGKLSAYDPAFFREMDKALRECARVLAPGGHLGLYVCDYFEKKKGFAPVGFGLFSSLAQYLEIVDVVSVVRHNKSLEKGNFHKAAEEQNFFLRGFNYLFIARKPEKTERKHSEPHRGEHRGPRERR